MSPPESYPAEPAEHSTQPPREVAAVPLPTQFGVFRAYAFECGRNSVYLALTLGSLRGIEPVLTRLHSQCLTGDAMWSLRCDCGVQLRTALRRLAAEGRGVLLYLTGQEGRGIGLVNKLRAYVEQDAGADTAEANVRLGLPVDGRDYREAAEVLLALGVRRVRLLTNNPAKPAALAACGLTVTAVEPLATAAHRRNRRYLRTKQQRFGHVAPSGDPPPEMPAAPVDVAGLVGSVSPRDDRPWVVVKYAQTIDGRIATATGDSKWISGTAERRISHTLRAGCDAVMVGVGTVLADDPQLTVRMVPGASPLRVVLDSRLRTPPAARVLSGEAATLVITAATAGPDRRGRLERAGAAVYPVGGCDAGVRLDHALRLLHRLGVATLLVEGGGKVITSLLRAGLADRLVVSVSPTILGSGVEAVGQLHTPTVAEGIGLTNRTVHLAGDDVIFGWDLAVADRSARHGACQR